MRAQYTTYLELLRTTAKTLLKHDEISSEYLSVFMCLIVYDISYILNGHLTNYLSTVENQSKRSLTLTRLKIELGILPLRNAALIQRCNKTKLNVGLSNCKDSLEINFSPIALFDFS